jgi:acetoin utilization deacetylase AcuC-like enzyme
MTSRKTIIFTHPDCLDHLTDRDHPECPERLKAVWMALDGPAFAQLEWREAPLAAIDDIRLVHPDAYIDTVLKAIPTSGFWNLDPDTVVSPGSRTAAFRACGAVCAAVDAVTSEAGTNAFCAVRPPGHHAEACKAQGFCLFNNVAVGAFAARHRHGLARIAIIDLDLHHGNGTQSIFWNEPEVLYASLHQWPFDPWTGAEDERGAHDNILNMPLKAGTDGATFRSVVEEKLMPRLQRFEPQLIMVSAGFDAHRDDPLGGLALSSDDYRWIAARLRRQADSSCAGKMVAVLEGGYNLQALGASVAAFVSAMLP